jgi:YVTN family beta-propeller protein
MGRVTLEFRVLGPLEAIADSVPLDVGGSKQRSVLALLLLRANEVVPRERLIDDLWGENPPATARDTLKVYVGRLRRLLSPNGGSGPLESRRGGYVLSIEPEQIDLHRFNRLAECGSDALAEGDAERSAALLREALALWRGTPLTDLGEAAFAQGERRRLEELRLAALVQRIAADLALGRASAVVPELQQLTREHPFDEQLHRQLMVALYRSGRQADALSVYRDLRRHLASELGLEPSAETRGLERSILTADPALSRPTGAQPRRSENGLDAVTEPKPQGRSARSSRRRRLVVVVAAAFVLIAAAAIGVAVTGDSQSAGGIGRVVGRIAVPQPGGPFVGRLAFGAGALWIRKSGDDKVLRIDPTTGRIVARIPVGFAYDTGIAVRGDDVWVTNGEDGTVSRIDAATNSVAATIRVGSYPLGIAATDDAVWVANHHSGTVSRIDPRRNRVVNTVPISPASHLRGPLHLVSADSQLWVADATDGAVVRVDPVRNRRTAAVLGSGPACGGMAAGGDSVWIASGCDQNKVTRIDARTAGVAAVIELPEGAIASDIAAGFGSIWATTTNGLLLRIDPKTNHIVAKRKLVDTVALTTGGGSVWVIDRTNRSVVRLQPAA